MTSGIVLLGFNPVLTSRGTATVTGGASSLHTREMTVGYDGAGKLTVQAGGTAWTNDRADVGDRGHGEVEITGNGSSWINLGTVYVGNATGRSGNILVADGGRLSAENIYLGATGGSGTLQINGSETARGTVAARQIIKDSADGVGTIDVDGGRVQAIASTDLFSGFAAGDVTLGAGGMHVDTMSYAGVNLSAVLDGSGGLYKHGSGTLTLAGAPNTHAGGTSVLEGTLRATAPNVLGQGLVSVATTTTLDIDGASQTVGGLVGSGTVSFENGGELRIDAGDASSTFAGSTSGNGFLNKTGTGILTLSGTTGHSSTNVDAGELIVSGNGAGTTFAVNSGARLSGSGTLGSTTVNGGGTLAASSLAIAGNLSLNPNARLAYALGTPGTSAPGGSSSHLTVTGNVTLDGTLLLSDPGLLAGRGYYRLISYGGTLDGPGFSDTDLPSSLTGQPIVMITSLPGFVDLRIGTHGSNALQTWHGGSGTWGDTGTNWLNDGGDLPVAWAGNTAVFLTNGGGTIEIGSTQAFEGLQFVADGYRLAATANGNGTRNGLDISGAHGEIRVLAGVTATIDAPISGSGGVDKTQDGTLVLEGPNSYRGETRLSGGVLSVSGDSSLGGPDIATGSLGGLRLQGGALRITGVDYQSTSRSISWSAQGGGFDIADEDNTFVVNQNLVGAGDLVKRGAGTLQLSGENQYGNTWIEAGTLIGNTRSVSGNIRNNGVLYFQQENDGTHAGNLAGTGTYIKAGAGVLSLAGDSSAPWEIRQGELVADASRFSGDARMSRDARLRFDQGADASYAGQLAGEGMLAKTGAGKLTLTGDNSAFAGQTDVRAGTLAVGGEGSGKLGGALTIGSGATLQGSGQVGTTTLLDGATIAPGNSIGTLTLAGDLTFSPGSVYRVEADPDSGDSDRIDVSGTARLAGSVVHVGPEGGFATTRQYTILTAGQVQGEFGSITSNYAYLDPKLAYGAHDVTMQLARKLVDDAGQPGTPTPPRPIVFADKANTSNQRATATALDTLPAGNTLHEYILTLPDGAPPTAFDSLSGEAHASVASTLMGLSSTVRSVPLNRLHANLNAGMRAGAPTAQTGSGSVPPSALPASKALPAWAELVGNWQTLDATENTARVRQRTTGVFVGADHAIGSGWRVGGALGYTDGKTRVDDRASQADVSSYSAAVYGGKSFEAGRGRLNVMAGAAYTWHDVDTKRSARVAGGTEQLTADYGASTAQVFTDLGYEIAVSERASVEPFVDLSYSDLRTRGFSESGGLAALNGRSGSQGQASSTVGVRSRSAFTMGGAEGTLRGSVGWRHAYGSVKPKTTMAFDGSQSFTVTGVPIARDAAVLELGADVAVSRSATIGVSYAGQYGNGNREHAGSVDVRWRF